LLGAGEGEEVTINFPRVIGSIEVKKLLTLPQQLEGAGS
jgi:hypothetical protein